MVANRDRDCPLLRRMLIAVSALAVGFTLNAAAQTAPAADHSADGQNFSSSTDYRAYLSTDALLGGTSFAEPSAAGGSPQYGGGGRSSSYPSYESRWSHIAFNGGFGFTIPIGNDTSFNQAAAASANGPLSPSQGVGYNLEVGGGWNFTKKLGVLLDYEFVRDSIPSDYLNAIQGGTNSNGLGGNINTWSFSIDPIYYLPFSHKSGAYVTGGGGFYRKVTNFTEAVTECDVYYGCYGVPETVDHFSSNQGGANFGIGIYRKIFGEDSNGKFYAQVKYVFVDSPGPTTANFGQGSGTEELLPVTFGIRF